MGQRILFLSHYGANPQFQQFFAETARQSGAQVKVIVPREIIYTNGWRPQLFPERKTINEVEYIPANLFDKRRYDLSGYFPELPKTILTFKPDTVIVTDEVYTLDAFYAVLYKLLFWCRFQIITWSQAHYMESPSAVRGATRLLLWCNKLFIRKFVTRNNKLAERIRAVLPSHKHVQTVYWSTDPNQFKSLAFSRKQLLEKLNHPKIQNLDDHQLIGYVGRLMPEKGLADVIERLPDLPNTTLLLVGKTDISYAQELLELVKQKDLQHRCLFLGDMEYDNLVYFYNLIDVLILPTKNHNNYYELFGRVLPEAMMCKTVVLGSTNGAIPEVIHNPACLFPQNNYNAFVSQLQALLNLSAADRATLLEQNYAYAVKHFTVEAFARNLLQLINA